MKEENWLKEFNEKFVDIISLEKENTACLKNRYMADDIKSFIESLLEKTVIAERIKAKTKLREMVEQEEPKEESDKDPRLFGLELDINKLLTGKTEMPFKKLRELRSLLSQIKEQTKQEIIGKLEKMIRKLIGEPARNIFDEFGIGFNKAIIEAIKSIKES
jgi:hypothetical protein